MYHIEYDRYGNTGMVSVGIANNGGGTTEYPLVTNVRDGKNGELKQQLYGNGLLIDYIYDSVGRLSSTKRNNAVSAEYTYDARGNLAVARENITGYWRRFSYDAGNRLKTLRTSDGGRIAYDYDVLDRVTKKQYNYNGVKRESTYGYGSDSRKGAQTLMANGSVGTAVNTTYDGLNRVTRIERKPQTNVNTQVNTTVTYVSGSGTNGTTMLPSQYVSQLQMNGGAESQVHSSTYAYDANGNISGMLENGSEIQYSYDALGQLTEVRDTRRYRRIKYEYDQLGNVQTKKVYTENYMGSVLESTVTYEYGDSIWKDKLTEYDGDAITYDWIGNPLQYRDGMQFTWSGRQLNSAVYGSTNATYTYNEDGIRTSKTVSGTKTAYFLEGSTVIAQKTGSNVMWFLYESDGTRAGLEYNGERYLYVYNGQGDVVALVGTNGVVAKYTYDEWGKQLSVKDANGSDITSASHIAILNPFRYRGYYYDTESGLYYLNSRYYDPTTGRFINADGLIGANDDLMGYNLFAYCSNNPVNRADLNGYFSTGLTPFISYAQVTQDVYKMAIFSNAYEKSTGKAYNFQDDYDSIKVNVSTKEVTPYENAYSDIITWCTMFLLTSYNQAFTLMDIALAIFGGSDTPPVGTYTMYSITMNKDVTFQYRYYDGRYRSYRTKPVKVTNTLTETYLVGPRNANFVHKLYSHMSYGSELYLYQAEPWRRR